MSKSHSAILEGILLIIEIIIGLYDIFSDFYYYLYYECSTNTICQLQFFFLFSFPSLMILIWSIMLAKMEVDNFPISDEQKKKMQQMELTENFSKFLCIKLGLSIEYYNNLLKVIPRTIFKALTITFAQYFRFLPFLVVSITYLQHKLIITPELLQSMKQELKQFFKDKAIKKLKKVSQVVPQKDTEISIAFRKHQVDKDMAILRNFQNNLDIDNFERNSQSSVDISNSMGGESSKISGSSSKIGGKASLDVIFDVNINPELKMVTSDETLKKLMWVGDIMEGFFQALPMMVLQYINNNDKNIWISNGNYNLFVYSCFYSSLTAVFINLYKVVTTLFDDDITSYYGLLTYLQEKSMTEMEEQFSVPERIEINNVHLLEKLVNLKTNTLKGTPSVRLLFPGLDKFNLLKIEQSIRERSLFQFQNIRLLSLNLRNNKMKTSFITNMLMQISRNHNIIELDIDMSDSVLDEISYISIQMIYDIMPQLQFSKIVTDDLFAFRPLSSTHIDHICKELVNQKMKNVKNLVLNLNSRYIKISDVDLIRDQINQFQDLNYIFLNLVNNDLDGKNLIWKFIPSKNQKLINSYQNLTFCHIVFDNLIEFGTSVMSFQFYDQKFFTDRGEISMVHLNRLIQNNRQTLFVHSFLSSILKGKFPVNFQIRMERTKIYELRTEIWDEYVRNIQRREFFYNVKLEYQLITYSKSELTILQEELENSEMEQFCLKLKKIPITYNDISSLSKSLRKTKVKSLVLRLQQVELTDAGVIQISQGFEHVKLNNVVLNFANNKLTNAGASGLAEGIRVTKAQTITFNLEDNAISDQGAMDIFLATKSSKAQKVKVALGQNNISQQVKERIQKQMRKFNNKSITFDY